MRFRTHSVERLDERTALAPFQLDELNELIDGGKSIPIGREERTGRMHHLFYSEKDDECMVAVLDEVRREIITILPMSHHGAWPVSLDAQQQARALILGSQPEQEAIRPLVDIDAERIAQHGFRIAEHDMAIATRRLFIDNAHMSNLRFTFHFSAGPGMRIERVGGSFSALPTWECQTIAALVVNTKFQTQIRQAINARRCEDLPSYLAFMSVRIGKKGPVIALYP